MSAEQPWLDDPAAQGQEQPWQNDASPPISGHATTFADDGDLMRHKRAIEAGFSKEYALSVGDNGIGSPHLGSIDTPNSYGVALPEDVLRNYLGNDPSAWRRARVETDQGKVPIVDIGPGKGPRSRGVVGDITAPLATAIGSNGMMPVNFRIRPDAGPDYMQDRQAWHAEQAQIAQALPTAGPWSKDPVAGTKAPQATQAQIHGPWENDPVIAPQQVPRGTQPQPPASIPENQPQTGSGTTTARTTPSPQTTQWEPETQPPQESPFDTVHKTVSNFWENAKQESAKLNLGSYQAEAYGPTLPSDAFEKQIKDTQASTLLTDQQKADTIDDLRNEQHRAQSRRLGNIVGEKYNIAQAEAAKPDQAFQQSVLGRVSSFTGQAAPYLASGAAGPLAPILAATQMSAGAYANEIERSNEKIKRLHPDWTDAQVLTESASAATESAKAAGGAGFLLSSIPIPVVGPLIARMVEKWGLSAASMVLAQQYARLQENAALKKKIDPGQDLYEGLRENLGQDIVQGLAFGLPHAFGEIGRGNQRGQPAPEVPRPEEARPPEAQTQGQTAAVAQPHPEAAPLEPATGEQPAPVIDKPQPSPPPSLEDERWVSAIANRFTEERSAAGEIGEIAPGVGYSRTDLREEGLKMAPEQVAQHVSDLMHNTGNPKLQAAAITAEEARLSQRSSQLSRLAEAQPANRQAQLDAENAFSDLTDFHNGPVAKLKNNWHAQGMTLQGEIPVDLSTFNGLREAWLRDVGKPTTPDVEATMRRTARDVRDAVTAENAALDDLAQKVDSLKRTKIPSADEVRNNIMERMKDVPCVTR